MLQLRSWLEACLPLARMRKQQKELGELLVSMDGLGVGDMGASYLVRIERLLSKTKQDRAKRATRTRRRRTTW